MLQLRSAFVDSWLSAPPAGKAHYSKADLSEFFSGWLVHYFDMFESSLFNESPITSLLEDIYELSIPSESYGGILTRLLEIWENLHIDLKTAAARHQLDVARCKATRMCLLVPTLGMSYPCDGGGCFHLDYEFAYMNARLAYERKRVAVCKCQVEALVQDFKVLQFAPESDAITRV